MARQSNIDELISSLYRDGLLTPPSTSRRGDHSNSTPPTSSSSSNNGNISANESFLVSFDESNHLMSPGSQRRNNAVIERIDRICDNVDQHLRLVGLPGLRQGEAANQNNDIIPPSRREISAPAHAEVVDYVDLSETQDITPTPLRPLRNQRMRASNTDDDDELVIVASNIFPVIDLCSPRSPESSRPRPIIQRNQLSRRTLDISCSESAVPTRRRRNSAFESDAAKKTIRTNGEKDSTASKPLICPVCMESCLEGRPTSTKCGHVFCEDCIKRAIRLKRKCPLCNAAVSSKSLFRLYF